MAEEILSSGGLYVDEITMKVRLIDPERATLTASLLKHFEEFEEAGVELLEHLGEIMLSMEKMSSLVEEAQMELIGTQSALLLESSERRIEEGEIEEWIRDKSNEVERCRSYLDSLARQKHEQLEVISNMKN